MITDDFQFNLESALKWERWEIELSEEIATNIPTTKSQPFSTTGVSELNKIEGRGSNRFIRDCPESGAHMADGTLYTGFYPYKQWISKEVVPHHDAIHANRKKGGGGSTRKGSMMKRKA